MFILTGNTHVNFHTTEQHPVCVHITGQHPCGFSHYRTTPCMCPYYQTTPMWIFTLPDNTLYVFILPGNTHVDFHTTRQHPVSVHITRQHPCAAVNTTEQCPLLCSYYQTTSLQVFILSGNTHVRTHTGVHSTEQHPVVVPAFSFCSSGLISTLLVLSTTYFFMKFSFSPDIILCG